MRLTPEREAEIRNVRSRTPDSDPWEAGVIDRLLIDQLLAEMDALRIQVEGWERACVIWRKSCEIHECNLKMIMGEKERELKRWVEEK